MKIIEIKLKIKIKKKVFLNKKINQLIIQKKIMKIIKKLMLLFLFTISSIKLCVPENVVISHHTDADGDIFDSLINPGKKKPISYVITFIAKEKCHDKIRIQFFLNDEPTKLMSNKPFYLRDIYITKLFDSKWKKSKYYKRYAYVSQNFEFQIEGDETLTYEIRDITDKKNPIILKKVKIVSNFNKQEDIKKLKIVTYGDQPMNAESLKKWCDYVLQEKPDLLILLGDYAYELDDDFGKKGDNFFNAIEPMTSAIPTLITPGNHDAIDDFKFLNFRILAPRAVDKLQNNFYHISLPEIRFFNINFEKYATMNLTEKKRVQKWFTIANTHFEEKTLPKFKILFSHRPFRCISKTNQEYCHNISYDKFFKGIEEIVAKSSFDLHLTGHVHQYQRTEMSIFQTENHLLNYFWDEPEYYMTTVVTGCAGKEEDFHIFKGEVGKKIDDKAIILDKAYGYTVIDIEYPLNKISGKFIDISNGRRRVKDEWTVDLKNKSDKRWTDEDYYEPKMESSQYMFNSIF